MTIREGKFDSAPALSYTPPVEHEILGTFIEALRQIFEEMELEIEPMDTEQGAQDGDQVVTSIGLTGDVKGILILSTDAPSAFKLVRAMSAGVPIPVQNERFTEIHLAALAELASLGTGDHDALGKAAALRYHAARRHRRAGPAEPRPQPCLSFHRCAQGVFGRLSLFLGIQERDLAADSRR